MTAEEFVRRLAKAMPDRLALTAYGLEDDEIATTQAVFRAQRRPSRAPAGASELARLVVEFDCSHVEVGLVRFGARLERRPFGVIVAFCEAEPVVVAPDGRIVLHDHARPKSELMRCAVDSEHFLDALGVFVDMTRDKAVWNGRFQEAVATCGRAAGGAEYDDFFRMLCGPFAGPPSGPA